MTGRADYKAFCTYRDDFRAIVYDIQNAIPDLQKLQQTLIASREGPDYHVDTPVVYNNALDDVNEDSDIRLIFVADNPGRREQAAANRRYLVGPSGKIAENFFKGEPDLGIDFRKNVIILNKTPVHTPRTICLKELCALGGDRLKAVIDESEAKMAALLAGFFAALRVPVWISGYSEMRKNGVFARYTSSLRNLLSQGSLDKNGVFLYRHFSMNQFTIDLRQKILPGESTADALRRIGAAYRDRILL
ncbi:MAG: hypothetical protein LBF80_02935 [Spirochaetaceae bacterium]|jgi:hypothetical protein|nr:hypothetical protein [Spirochaetaceae bacterium]